jgi:hypothetical protein
MVELRLDTHFFLSSAVGGGAKFVKLERRQIQQIPASTDIEEDPVHPTRYFLTPTKYDTDRHTIELADLLETHCLLTALIVPGFHCDIAKSQSSR